MSHYQNLAHGKLNIMYISLKYSTYNLQNIKLCIFCLQACIYVQLCKCSPVTSQVADAEKSQCVQLRGRKYVTCKEQKSAQESYVTHRKSSRHIQTTPVNKTNTISAARRHLIPTIQLLTAFIWDKIMWPMSQLWYSGLVCSSSFNLVSFKPSFFYVLVIAQSQFRVSSELSCGLFLDQSRFIPPALDPDQS